MVKLLFKKMLRDISRSRAAYLISILIVAIGFCGYCVLSITAGQMEEARIFFYETTNFCDGFASVNLAPASMSRRLEQIEGIASAQARIVRTVRVDSEDDKTRQLMLISTTEGGMNLPYLSDGTLPAPKERTLVLGDGFSAAHSLKAGDTITIIVNGSKIDFSISGSGISPENTYLIQDISLLLPDTASFDAAFVDYSIMENLFSIQGLANEFIFTLEEGADFEQVRLLVEEALTPYGCYRVYDLDGNLSCSMLQAELEQLHSISAGIPFLFLTVAAVILYITLHRLVEQQRTQIGTLMAAGIRQKAICFHYMGFGIFVGFTGGLLGGMLGMVSAKPLVDYYMIYFKLPAIAHSLSLSYLFIGIGISTIFCGGLGWLCAKRLWKLTPAEALRPASPPVCTPSPLEYLPAFSRLFTEAGIMAIRSLFRNKRRSLISLFGIACAFMMIASLVSMNTLIDIFIFDFVEVTQKQDATISFTQPVLKEDARQLLRPYDVEDAEYILSTPITLNSTSDSIDCTVQTLSGDSRLCLLYDEAQNTLSTRPGGIVITVHMGEQLGVVLGDWLEMETTGVEKRVLRVTVSGLSTQYMGSTAYITETDAGRLAENYNACTSILIKAPPETLAQLKTDFEDVPYVSSVESRSGILDSFNSMMGSVNVIMGTMAILGILIGFAVIYTSSLISFEEVKREIATMLMLGMRSKECLDVIATGQWLLTIGGILLGIPMTFWASNMMASSLGTDLYSIPNFVDGHSILLSICLTFLAVSLSSAAISKKLKKISAVDLLRERE